MALTDGGEGGSEGGRGGGRGSLGGGLHDLGNLLLGEGQAGDQVGGQLGLQVLVVGQMLQRGG